MSKKDKAVPSQRQIRGLNLGPGIESALKSRIGKGLRTQDLNGLCPDKLVRDLILDWQARGYVFSQASENSVVLHNPKDNSYMTIKIKEEGLHVTAQEIPEDLVPVYGGYFSKRNIGFKYSTKSA